MINYTVQPHVGIGPVRLGMTREESRAVMGSPAVFQKGADDAHLTDAYHEHTFQVFFDKEDRVEYVELTTSPLFAALYRGVDVHRTDPEKVIALLKKDGAFDPDDPEVGHSYLFPTLELSVWRHLKGENFATVGVGRDGYFSQE